jgi:starch synthase
MDDPTALASAANQLLSNPELRDRLGRQGRERAILEFDHIVMGRRSLAIYQEILSSA